MSVRDTMTSRTGRSRAAASLTVLALTAIGATACGQAPASHQVRGPGQAANPAAAHLQGRLTAAVILDADGHAWAPGAAGAVLVSTDAGRSWSTVRLPGRPALGHSVVVSGRTIAAVTVTSGGLAYQRSTDGGTTWRRIAVPTRTPTDQASIALSADGRKAAVLAELPGSAGSGDLPELSVGPSAGPLTPVTAPVAGSIAWAGQALVLTGGPLQSRLYTSRDNGARWTQGAVTGRIAPRFNVPPSTPSLGAPLAGDGATVTIPVTEHRGGRTIVRLYRSPDGSRFTPGPAITVGGATGAGVTALVSAAGPGRFMIASPGSTRLHLVTGLGTRETTLTPHGLTGTLDSVTFSGPRDGLAETTRQSCTGKQRCHSAVTLYQTSDGGHTWRPVTS
jgi:photosystem II stability/assembly factor-like uncharacterized protein